ncbi:hypothetical protein V6N12_025517 [Hibiscus sabdariffa]|uniref:RNase H type-1 domain-containing protein n=1 Tax=Hibiscus sabdariffa TaxID=183260 RepID=A0ABR2CJ76_9ROSI
MMSYLGGLLLMITFYLRLILRGLFFGARLNGLGWVCPLLRCCSSEVLFCPLSLRSLKVDRNMAGPSSWVKPWAESLKLNVDGAAVGGRTDATSAELNAILEAVTLFRKSKWPQSFKLLLETDCSLCVQWLERPSLAPHCFKPVIEDCLEACDGFRWSIEAVTKSANSTADKLAKSGISRVAPLVWFS